MKKGNGNEALDISGSRLQVHLNVAPLQFEVQITATPHHHSRKSVLLYTQTLLAVPANVRCRDA